VEAGAGDQRKPGRGPLGFYRQADYSGKPVRRPQKKSSERLPESGVVAVVHAVFIPT
jgi:hypothetical protein